MKIEINGKQYSNFTSMTASVSFENVSNAFSLTLGPDKRTELPVSMDDECAIYIDTERVLTGFIEEISGEGSKDDHTIRVVGRDKTSDFVDSKIGSLSDIKSPISLKRLTEIVLGNIRANIDVVDLSGAFLKEDVKVSADPGENAFDYVERIARKLNVVLSPNSEGDIVLQKAAGVTINDQIVNRAVDSGSNNVLSYRFTYDNKARFNRYETIGNMNLNSLSLLGKQTPSKVVGQKGIAIDESVREGRQYVITSENAGSEQNMKDRSNWEANVRKARSRVYKAVVDGHRNRLGELWAPNTIVRVIDDHAKINDSMLIRSVDYRFSPDRGSTSEISFINKNSYTLEISEPIDEKAELSLEDAFSG